MLQLNSLFEPVLILIKWPLIDIGWTFTMRGKLIAHPIPHPTQILYYIITKLGMTVYEPGDFLHIDKVENGNMDRIDLKVSI